MKRNCLFLIIAILLTLASSAWARGNRMIVKVYLDAPGQILLLNDLALDFATMAVTDHAEIVVTESELAEIHERGFRTEVVQREDAVFVPSEYHTLEETWFTLDSLHQLYPAITKLDTCGYSHRWNLPIPRFIVSGNAGVREDEPSAMINGMHHAREPMGNEISIYAIKWILSNYPDSSKARRWVDSMDLHFVPITNPDGWKYIVDSSLVSPWWRKNLRDNGNNGGPANPDSDGVDLNRNWDWRWTSSGATNPTDWTYRGPYPNSESEVQTLINLARQRGYVVGISYHSYGCIVYYPWSYNSQVTPDEATLYQIAQNMASQIGGYAPSRIGGSNQSSVWLYGALGMYDFLIETARSFIPPPETIAVENQKNFRGITYLLNRVFISGVTGHVRDSITLDPLAATVEVLYQTGDSILPRTSDSLFGRYYRLLYNGTHSMRFSKPGYIPKTINNIAVVSDSLTKLDVLLARQVGEDEQEALAGSDRLRVRPNPFRGSCRIAPGKIKKPARLTIYDAAGRAVKSFTLNPGRALSDVIWDGKDDAGRPLDSGVFFYYLKDDATVHIGKILKMR